jgi:hypothetical protein
MAGSDSYRHRIMEAIKARMGGIRSSAGYRTDIGRRGFEWREPAFQDLDIPCHELRDTGEEMAEAGGGRTLHTLRVEITALVKGSEGRVPALMRDAAADIMQAIGEDDEWGLSDDAAGLGRVVLGVRPVTEESFEVVQEARRYGGVRLIIEVEYITDRWGA